LTFPNELQFNQHAKGFDATHQILSFLESAPGGGLGAVFLFPRDARTDSSTALTQISASLRYFSRYLSTSAAEGPPRRPASLAFFLMKSSASFSSWRSAASAFHSSRRRSAFTWRRRRPLMSRQASKLLVLFWPALEAAPLRREPNPPLPPRRRRSADAEGNCPSAAEVSTEEGETSRRPVTRRSAAAGTRERDATASRRVAPETLGVVKRRQRVRPSRSRTRIWHWGASAIADGGGAPNPSSRRRRRREREGEEEKLYQKTCIRLSPAGDSIWKFRFLRTSAAFSRSSSKVENTTGFFYI
jgi:hypothetical protein